MLEEERSLTEDQVYEQKFAFLCLPPHHFPSLPFPSLPFPFISFPSFLFSSFPHLSSSETIHDQALSLRPEPRSVKTQDDPEASSLGNWVVIMMLFTEVGALRFDWGM